MVEHKDWFISLKPDAESITRKISIERLIGEHGRESDIESGKDAEKKKDKVIGYGLVLGRKSSSAQVDETSGDFSLGCISRAHAQINITNNGHVYISDLGSRHGTSILTSSNDAAMADQKIRVLPFAPVQLLDGDTIILGRPLTSKEGNVGPLHLKVTFQAPQFGTARALGGRKSMGTVNKNWCQKHFASHLDNFATSVLAKFQQAVNSVPNALSVNVSLNSIEIEDSDDEFCVAAIQATQAAEASAEELIVIGSDSEREQSVDSVSSVRYGVPPSILYLSEAEEDLPRSRPSESATPPVIHINYLRGHEPGAQKAESSVEVIQVENDSEEEASNPDSPRDTPVELPALDQGVVDYATHLALSREAEVSALAMPDVSPPPVVDRFPSSPPLSPPREINPYAWISLSPIPSRPALARSPSGELAALEGFMHELEQAREGHAPEEHEERDPDYGRFYSYSSSAGDDYFDQMASAVNHGESEVAGYDRSSNAWSPSPSLGPVDIESDAQRVADSREVVSTAAADLNEGLLGKSLFVAASSLVEGSAADIISHITDHAVHTVVDPTADVEADVFEVTQHQRDLTPSQGTGDLVNQSEHYEVSYSDFKAFEGPGVESPEDEILGLHYEDEDQEGSNPDEEDPEGYAHSHISDERSSERHSSESDHMEVGSEDDEIPSVVNYAPSSLSMEQEDVEDSEMSEEDAEEGEEGQSDEASQSLSDDEEPEEEPIRSIGSGAFPSPVFPDWDSLPSLDLFAGYPVVAGGAETGEILITRGPPVEPVPELAHNRTPSVSTSESSRGPITPESTGSRKRPLEDVDVQVHDSDATPPPAKAPKVANGDSANKQVLVAPRRSFASALGLMALGAAIGTVGTIAGLMQIAE